MFFFFNDTATTEIYTLSLHDALPISNPAAAGLCRREPAGGSPPRTPLGPGTGQRRKPSARKPASPNPPATRSFRSEEHTSELQSQSNLVCRLLLEKKKKIKWHHLVHE